MDIRRAAGTCALMALALVGASTPAHADSFPGTMYADGDNHTYCYTSTFTTDTSVGSYAMWVLAATTDMHRTYQSCTSKTDVWWWQADLPGGVRGQWSCYAVEAWWLPHVCETADVTLDFPELDKGADDWHDRRKTAVHEVGHSVGLDHDTVSAMRSGEIPSTSLQWRRYSAHDISHIDAAY